MWACRSSDGSVGWVASGMRLASTASMSSLRFAELLLRVGLIERDREFELPEEGTRRQLLHDAHVVGRILGAAGCNVLGRFQELLHLGIQPPVSKESQNGRAQSRFGSGPDGRA
mgnify:CR=1 FL=1